MPTACKPTNQGPSVSVGISLVAVTVLSACAYRYGSRMMLPDNFNYITYWQQLFDGSLHATSMQTPKPLLVIVFGILWKMTGGLGFLIILFIGMGTLVLCEIDYVKNRLCGLKWRWLPLGFLLPNAVFLRAVLSGFSELLSAAGVIWLIGRHLEDDRIKPPDLYTAIALFTLNLIRPENWVLSAGVAIAAVVAIMFRPSQASGRAKALWEARRSLATVSFPLLAPLVWFGFDYLAFGNLLFSFQVTAQFAGLNDPAQLQVHWWEYLLEVTNAIRGQVSLLALGCAAMGVAVVSRRRPSLLILLGLPFITTVLFYLVAYLKGLALYERFFFVPVLITLVVSCIGLASATDWLLTLLVRRSRDYSIPSVGKRLLVGLIMMLLLVIEHRSLPSKILEFNTYAQWRRSALSAAEAVRQDTDYLPSRRVIVRVEDFALVAWTLRSDARNLIESQIYKREGSRRLSGASIAYFIINQPHQGKLFPELATGRVAKFQTTVMYDDGTTVVYKANRVSN